MEVKEPTKVDWAASSVSASKDDEYLGFVSNIGNLSSSL